MYDLRIKWLRSELRSLVALQISDKAKLRQPHDTVANAEWLQHLTIRRSSEITALLIMLNSERNKVRPPESQREHSHAIKDKWAAMAVNHCIEKFLKRLDEAHPYPRLYVVVDHKLSPIQKGIQGSHAIVELFKRYGIFDHSGLVFLETEDLYALMRDLAKHKCRYAYFQESHWQNKMTAIAIEPLMYTSDVDTPPGLADLSLAGSKPESAQWLQKVSGILHIPS